MKFSQRVYRQQQLISIEIGRMSMPLGDLILKKCLNKNKMKNFFKCEYLSLKQFFCIAIFLLQVTYIKVHWNRKSVYDFFLSCLIAHLTQIHFPRRVWFLWTYEIEHTHRRICMDFNNRLTLSSQLKISATIGLQKSVWTRRTFGRISKF